MKRVKRKHIKGAGKRQYTSVRKDEVDDTPEHTVMMHASRHWAVCINEIDAFGPVTVRNSEGEVTRVIEVDALRRPWQEKVGSTWNNCIFPKRNSAKGDRV